MGNQRAGPEVVLDKLHSLVGEATKEVRQKEKEIRSSGLNNLTELDELAEMNARKIYYESLLRKLNKVAGK